MRELATLAVALMLLIGSAKAMEKGTIAVIRVACVSPAHIEMLIKSRSNEEFMEFLDKARAVNQCVFNPAGGEVVVESTLSPSVKDEDGDIYEIIEVRLKVGKKLSNKLYYTWKHLGKGL